MKDIILKFTKSIDGDGKDTLTIQIDDKGAYLPTSIVTEFLESESKSITVTIPE